MCEFYSFGRKKPNNPLNAGFVKENIKKGTFDRFPNATCKIVAIYVTEAQYLKIKDNLIYLHKNKGKYKYNFVGLLSAWGGIPINRNNAYFCSQFVSLLLIKAKILPIYKEPGLISPNDILRTLNKRRCTLLYSGPILNFDKIRGFINENRIKKFS